MEKKRLAASEPDTGLPPAKHFRQSDDAAPAQTHATHHPSTAAPDPTPNPDADQPEALVTFQRAQLAAKISEQHRDNAWLRDKVDELQKLVAVLDAAPRAALYHMCAVREDLTLTLARMGLTHELDPSDSPIAATMLNAEEVTNESLNEMPTAIKRLTAQIVLAIESNGRDSHLDAKLRQANDELHRRVREVSDQLERYAEREKQSLVSSTTFRDEYDDLREESSLQRRRIVALELKLKEKEESINAQKGESRSGDESTVAAKTDISREAGDPASNPASAQNGDVEALAAVKEVNEKRLEELTSLNAEHKRVLAELETQKAELAKRDSNVVPIKTILNTGLYQTMEANLQQLYLKERNWQMERDALKEELEAQQRDFQEQLEATRAAHEKTVDAHKKQMEEMRRLSEAAKVEKDKVVMTYEARKMEAGNAAAVIDAATKRANVSDQMRAKLSKESKQLKEELETLRKFVKDMENQVKENVSKPDSRALIERLRKELEDERVKSAGFIEEVENLSNMFGEVESENEKVVKLLTEKEQVLSKVMAERLRGRQLLTTVKEENRVLVQGREMDADKIKALTAAVAASKKAAQEATAASLKEQQEARELSTTLEKRRRIADDATVASRAAIAEKDEMKRERDVYMSRADQVVAEFGEDRFQAKRLREELDEVERRAKKAEEQLQHHQENGRSSNVDSIRDEIIRELRKKLNCSVVTTRPKEVVLLRCGHLFSRQCTDNLISTRNRKCPICGKAFGNDDVRSVFF